MSTYKSNTDSEEMLNHLLAEIVIANGGSINSNDNTSSQF